MSEPRAAGVRQVERLAAGASSAEIAKRARVETQATTRVYVHEWILVSRQLSQESAAAYVQSKYEGRLEPDDLKIVEDAEGPVVSYEVWARLWNVVAEWKHSWQAEKWAMLLREERPDLKLEDILTVGRNTRTEHRLRAYGKLLLPKKAESDTAQ